MGSITLSGRQAGLFDHLIILVEEAEHGGDESHGDEHGGYDLDDFRMAVMMGTHLDGEPLSREMPRWQINDEDLSALFEFLITLQ